MDDFGVNQEQVSTPGRRLLFYLRFPNYFMAFFACARTLAHRFLAAFAIFALPAAERTRFFIPDSSRPGEFPNAFPAARTPSNCFCNLPNCFSSFRSSRLLAARMFTESSARHLSQSGYNAPDVPWK